MRDQHRLYRRKKNGRELPTWWCEYYDAGHKRIQRSTGCRDRKAAEARARELERVAADPAHAAAHKITIRDALQRVVVDRAAQGRAKGTVEMYASKAGAFLRVWGEDFPLAQVDAKPVDAFIEQRLTEGASRSTIGKELTTLRIALKLARRRGEYHLAIEQVMPERWTVNYEPGTRHLTAEAFERLLPELLADRGAHVCFIVATGADLAPSLTARRIDIDLQKGMVQVGGTKTAHRARTVPIAFPWQRALLARVLEVCGGKPGPLFRPWGNAVRELAAACQRAGVERVTPRDLRRTYAQWLRGAKVPPSLVGPMMGHGDGRMVEKVYGRLTPEELARQVAAYAPQEAAGLVLSLSEDGRLSVSREPTSAELNALRAGLARLEERCHARVTRSVRGGAENAGGAEREPLKTSVNTVPRGGIEPSTRGFSVPASRRSYDGRSSPQRRAG